MSLPVCAEESARVYSSTLRDETADAPPARSRSVDTNDQARRRDTRPQRLHEQGVLLMMKSARVLILAGLLTAGAAAPAMATWVPVTAVPLDSRPTIDVVD